VTLSCLRGLTLSKFEPEAKELFQGYRRKLIATASYNLWAGKANEYPNQIWYFSIEERRVYFSVCGSLVGTRVV
jgi:hypothetical protein